jgi:hypothetical protein
MVSARDFNSSKVYWKSKKSEDGGWFSIEDEE